MNLFRRTQPAEQAEIKPVPTIAGKRSISDTVLRAIASASTVFKRDITSFCDLATCNRHGIVTFSGDYVTIVRLRGMRRITSGPEIAESSNRLRLALASQFANPGHALQFFYTADPEGVSATIERNLNDRRTIAAALNAEFEDIFAERLRVLPSYMRQERILLAVWTRPGRLSSQELRQAKVEKRKALAGIPPLGDAQDPTLGSLELGTIHTTFVQSFLDALGVESVQAEALGPEDGLRAIREEIYPETIGSDWTPSTPLRSPGSALHDPNGPKDVADILWSPLREQLFRDDALTADFSTVRLGTQDWTPLELTRVPEVPHAGAPHIPIPSFTELSAKLAGRRMPWRTSALIESVRPGYMMWKDLIATFLKFGSNLPVNAAFAELKGMRASQTDSVVKFRMAFATSAPAGDVETLKIRASRLEQAVQSWGGASASRVCGDPLAGVMSSIPGIAIASTAPPSAGPLSQILAMLPWTRPGNPWRDGAMLFRAADGTMVPYDPAGSGREAVLDLFVAPSRRGKSMLANALLLNTVLSPAAMTTQGPRVPLIAKLDVGDSSSGFVDMVRSGLRAEDQHQAIHIPFQLIDDHTVNVFDTETCVRHPLKYHRTFLSNFLGMVCTPLEGTPFEGMNQLIDAIVPAAFEFFADEGPSVQPKIWRPKIDPNGVDLALAHHRLSPDPDTPWWNIADMFAEVGDMRMAHRATLFAVPTIADLVRVVREPRFERFKVVTPTSGTESVTDIFQRYITHFVNKFPTLCRPTKLDLGDARITVIDIGNVAPEGHGESQRQTELMYLLGFHIVARNFFLDPDDANDVPENVRPHHRRRFEEFRESFKRIECDEFQRTAGAPHIQRQFEEAARRSAKLNVKIGLASQKLDDFGEYLISHSTGRFILGAPDEKEAANICERFQLSPAARSIVHTGLNGPRPDGSGAPLIWQIRVRHEVYELFVLNLMGPIELWALSTNPKDTALRRRLYAALGTSEARRRLAKVFPHGSAESEIERRETALIRAGQDASIALGGVVEELALELRDGTGLGTVIRSNDDVSGLTNASRIVAA